MEDLVVILVIEDDQLIQSVVEEALTEGGFDVAIASSGEQPWSYWTLQIPNAARL